MSSVSRFPPLPRIRFREAARIAGVPVTRTRLAAHVISGLMAAVAAMIPIGRAGAAGPTVGTPRNGPTLMNVRAFDQLPATGIISIVVAMLSHKRTNGKQG